MKSRKGKKGEGRERASGKSEYAAETKIRTRGRSTHRASERASKGGRGGGRVLNGGGTIKALFHGQREREPRERERERERERGGTCSLSQRRNLQGA